jgi:hypothetical protein
VADDEKRQPPGEFVSDDQRAQTARFLADLRKRLKRDKPEEAKLGPPERPRRESPSGEGLEKEGPDTMV